MTYEDIFETVGECGPWQIQQLFLLWVPILVCGAQLQVLDRVLLNPEELFCSIAGCEVFLDIPNKEMTIGDDFCTIIIPKVVNGSCFWNRTEQKNNPVYSCSGHQKVI